MERTLTIRYTSDMHGYFLPTRYAERGTAPVGLLSLMGEYPHDGNTLILDGGDTLQGSPLTNFYERLSPGERARCLSDGSGLHPVAAMMNLAGYQYVTLGNHDFNYGLDELEAYLNDLDALCLCANIRDRACRLPIAPYAIHRLENGLCVGIAGVCTHFVSRWENPGTVALLEIEDAFGAARRVREQLRGQCDVSVLLYHGGYECDLTSGRLLSDTGENEACRICRELDYDLVLTAHQHAPTQGRMLGNSYTLQPGYRAQHACAVTVSVPEDGPMTFDSRFVPPSAHPDEDALALVAPLEESVQRWLDTPAGQLSRPLIPQDHLEAARMGSPLANFVNTVQRWVSGAEVSSCALPNEYKGLPQQVTIRDVVSTYIYSNTLVVLRMTRDQLREYIERSACYFDLDGDGRIVLGETFTRPKVQHYNYDFFSGVDYVIDVRRPKGSRVTSLRLRGREMAQEDTVEVCVNSYRRGGTSGYGMVSAAPVVREILTDVADALIEYITRNPNIEVDGHRWGVVLPE